MASAIDYSLKRWTALVHYIGDGRVGLGQRASMSDCFKQCAFLKLREFSSSFLHFASHLDLALARHTAVFRRAPHSGHAVS